AEELDRRHIDTIVGIARAGLLPATVLACSLRRELLPVRLSRREQDEVVTERPVWKVDLSPEVAGRRIAIVDEMADTGETLALASQRARELGAAEVLTVALISHSWADPAPEVSSLVTDALVVFPWDR